jgi:hypothetical protein
LIFVVILGIGAALAYAKYRVTVDFEGLWILDGALVLASVVSSAIQVADQWSKAVVLRLGKFRSLQGPGLFLIIPLIDTIPYWIDIRVLTSSFEAEKTLTKDTVPVDVDAVLFWKIVDPKKAALGSITSVRLLLPNHPRAYFRCITDPQLVPLLCEHSLKLMRVTRGFHTHDCRSSSRSRVSAAAPIPFQHR